MFILSLVFQDRKLLEGKNKNVPFFEVCVLQYVSLSSQYGQFVMISKA